MKKQRPPEFSYGSNSARVARVQQLRRGNAAGPVADRRTKRVRTRGDARRTAVSRSREG